MTWSNWRRNDRIRVYFIVQDPPLLKNAFEFLDIHQARIHIQNNLDHAKNVLWDAYFENSREGVLNSRPPPPPPPRSAPVHNAAKAWKTNAVVWNFTEIYKDCIQMCQNDFSPIRRQKKKKKKNRKIQNSPFCKLAKCISFDAGFLQSENIYESHGR